MALIESSDSKYLTENYHDEDLGYCSKCGKKIVFSHIEIFKFSKRSGEPVLDYVYQCEFNVNSPWWKTVFSAKHDPPQKVRVDNGKKSIIMVL